MSIKDRCAVCGQLENVDCACLGGFYPIPLAPPPSITLNEVAKQAHDMARSKGFWDGESADVTKKLLLIHSEVTEAAEEVRAGGPAEYFSVAPADAANPGDGKVQRCKPEGVGPELADVLIRTLDLMHGLGMNVEKLVTEKMAFNATRGPKHGKRF